MVSTKILIDGLDYAGKSTLAERIVEHYSRFGYKIKYNKGNITKTDLEDFIKQELYAESSDIIRLNSLLTLGPLIDALTQQNETEEEILVQESYIDRTIAYNKVHNIPYFSEILNNLYSNLLDFDISFFLDTSIEERKKRYLERDEKNKYDDMIFTDQEKFIQINEELKKSISRRKNYHYIDNTTIGPKDTLNIAKSVIEKHLHQI